MMYAIGGKFEGTLCIVSGFTTGRSPSRSPEKALGPMLWKAAPDQTVELRKILSSLLKAKEDVLVDVFRYGSDSRRYDFVILFGKKVVSFITQAKEREISKRVTSQKIVFQGETKNTIWECSESFRKDVK